MDNSNVTELEARLFCGKAGKFTPVHIIVLYAALS